MNFQLTFTHILFGFLLISGFSTYGQTKITWIELGNLAFEVGQGGMSTLDFSEKIKQLEGQEVIIEGYVIPMDVEGKTYALSAYPNASCFCGAAGQESIMRLELKDHRIRYAVDEYHVFKGKLVLNYLPNDFFYILKKAEEIK